jgi:prepilin-type N-terminal cleavage/methylation domain-containing protein
MMGRNRPDAFSLLELLVVIGIMGMLFALSGPIVGALKGAGDFGKSTGDIQGILEQARAYAMANNTYVYAGIQEVNVINPTASNGVGRVALGVVASTTGMRPYTNSPAALPVANIIPLGKVRYFDNLHITNASSLSSSGNMTRPTANVDLSACGAQTTFSWTITGTTQYNFTNIVVEFSPQGTASVQTNSSTLCTPPSYLELALLPCQGTVATTNANQAAIQINGFTGTVNIYRP